jgi:hypothetical protein
MVSLCLEKSHPEVAEQWHPTKNGELTPVDVTSGSNRMVWWRCPVASDHEWKAIIANRVRGGGCPCCSIPVKKVVPSNCLSVTHPAIASQWHITRNVGLSPNMVTFGSTRRVWWQCSVSEDHVWQATIANRTSLGRGCPCCSGRKVVKSNCLETTYPDVAKQWHPIKNGNLLPSMVTGGCGKRVWWQCSVAEDHEWQSSINHRTNGRGCPCCSVPVKKIVQSNCLLSTHPEIAKQWSTKNKLTPHDVVSGCNNKFWWRCNKGHEWLANINKRTTGECCPVCKESKGESCITELLRKFKLNNKIKNYCRQKRYKQIRDKRPLPFDFMVQRIDGRTFLIEYNGRQHYELVNFTGKLSDVDMKNNLDKVKKHDTIKRDGTKAYNIPYLVIPYWQFGEIEENLKEFIERRTWKN